MSPHTAATAVAVDPLIAELRSPRSFDVRQGDGTPRHAVAYDIGLATAQLSLQACALKLHAHQMGGSIAGRPRPSPAIPDGCRPPSVTAARSPTPTDRLSQELRDRKTAARERRHLTESAFAESSFPESRGARLPARHNA